MNLSGINRISNEEDSGDLSSVKHRLADTIYDQIRARKLGRLGRINFHEEPIPAHAGINDGSSSGKTIADE